MNLLFYGKKETTDIHGITNQKVANEPTFEQLHKEIIDIISNAC